MNVQTSTKIKLLIKKLIPTLIIFGFITGCGNDDPQPDVQSATSSICSEVTGAKAIFWDIENGIPRGDLPGGIPTIKNPGGTYGFTDFPLLGFQYPAGWTPNSITGFQTVGVNLVRQDGNGLWRYLSYPVSGFVTAQQLRDFEIEQMYQNLGLSGNYQVICTNAGTVTPATGISQSYSNILLSVGGFTALIAANTTIVDGLNTTNTNVKVSIAPINEFDAHIFDVFLAIEFQLLYRDSATDSDGDGIIDDLDNFPLDPTKT